jgi:hypothetical protein
MASATHFYVAVLGFELAWGNMTSNIWSSQEGFLDHIFLAKSVFLRRA